MSSTSSLDAESLGNYLSSHIDSFEGLQSIEKFSGGQSNPTFLITANSGQYVLRRQPPGELLKSAHAVDREFKVISALRDTHVPVPIAYHLCEDRSVIGSMFYVMSYEAGRIFWNAALPELDKPQRGLVHHQLIEVMAAIHNVDLEAVGLSDYGKGKNYFERQIGLWTKQYRAAETETIDNIEQLISWLPANMPADIENVTLLHGDYRLDNVILHAQEPRIIAVLDWELSTLGNPVADLAYFCMGLRLPGGISMPGLAGLDRQELGVPSEEEIVARYCELRGIENIPNWNFYLVFSFFRLCSICQGVYKRALMGNASNEKALDVGKTVHVLSDLAVDLI